MRRINILLAIVASILAVSCVSKLDINDLQSQLDELKTGKIATIEQQVSSMQSSIITLQATDTQLAAFISTLQMETSDLKTKFSIMEKSLSDRIDNLGKYSDEELGKTKDWVSATFATLEQYQAVLGELAAIKESIKTLDKDLRKEIEDSIMASEESMKGWVNEQFTGYYTIAQMDAKLKALQDADDANADAIGKVASDLEAAKAELTEAYNKAITDAISKYNGEITAKLAADIKTATDALQKQIDELDDRVTALEGMIQSVTIIPEYSDGSVNVEDNTLHLSCIVSPSSVLKGQTKDNYKILVAETLTKATIPTIIDVNEATFDLSNGLVIIKADLSAIMPIEDGKNLFVAILVIDGKTDLVSEFVPTTITNNTGASFVSLSINLPAIQATKANNSSSSSDNDEYKVEDGTLVIFAGSGEEDDLTLRSAYDLPSAQWNKEAGGQISITRKVTQQIRTANILNSESLYAFVILNRHDQFGIAASSKEPEITTLYHNDKELSGKTFAEFKQISLDAVGTDSKSHSFVMTNMPYAAQVGGANATTAVAPKTLVEINSEAIYSTKEDAETSAPAAEINVERLVAKVTVNIKPGLNKLENSDVALSTIGWFIDNTNPTTYVVRNVADPVGATPYTYLTYNVNNFYRMISGSYVRAGLNQARTFWGIDANYNTTATNLISEAGKVVDNRLMDFDASHVNQGGRLRPAGSHYYCAENTFDVEHQTVRNTTRVVFAVEFNEGNDFYTISTEPCYIRSEADMKEYIADVILHRVDVSNWLMKYLDNPSAATDKQLRAIFTVTITTDGAAPGKALASIALNETGLAAVVTNATKLADAKTDWESSLSKSQSDYIAKNINDMLNFYADGVAYYQALIRHFDNTETPWEGKAQMVDKTESIYNGNDENAYLGRYGVVRNNWYDITITGIRQIGSSTIPELTDEPDDIIESFLKIRQSVSLWAHSPQSGIL